MNHNNLIRYWQARSHAQTWRTQEQIRANARKKHSETVAEAFFATICFIFAFSLFCLTFLLLV